MTRPPFDFVGRSYILRPDHWLPCAHWCRVYFHSLVVCYHWLPLAHWKATTTWLGECMGCTLFGLVFLFVTVWGQADAPTPRRGGLASKAAQAAHGSSVKVACLPRGLPHRAKTSAAGHWVPAGTSFAELPSASGGKEAAFSSSHDAEWSVEMRALQAELQAQRPVLPAVRRFLAESHGKDAQLCDLVDPSTSVARWWRWLARLGQHMATQIAPTQIAEEIYIGYCPNLSQG